MLRPFCCSLFSYIKYTKTYYSLTETLTKTVKFNVKKFEKKFFYIINREFIKNARKFSQKKKNHIIIKFHGF